MMLQYTKEHNVSWLKHFDDEWFGTVSYRDITLGKRELCLRINTGENGTLLEMLYQGYSAFMIRLASGEWVYSERQASHTLYGGITGPITAELLEMLYGEWLKMQIEA